MRWAVHVARTGENRNIYRTQVRKFKGERKFGRPVLRLEDNVKMDFLFSTVHLTHTMN
jgi:hypothetical protein